MRRRFDRRRARFDEEEANPMAGVSNLADVMLVLAVGIMLALVINWHISVNGGTVTQMDAGQMTELDASDYGTAAEGMDPADGSSSLEERGTVYVDRETGKMYLVETGASDDTGQTNDAYDVEE